MLPKRLTWFSLGALSGAAGVVYGYVRAREAATVEPARVADAVVGAGRRLGGGVRDVVAESRAAVREVEDELRRGHDARRVPQDPPGVDRLGERRGSRVAPAVEAGVGSGGRRGERPRRRRRYGDSAPGPHR